jgi:beta-lactam-binding protein with PASTA domain
VFALWTPLVRRQGLLNAVDKEQTMKTLFAFMIAALALVVFVLPVQAEQVVVPNVVGASYADAVKTLQAAGFNTSMTIEKAATAPQNGKVSKQSIAPYQRVDRGTVVKLTVYSYVETVKVSVAPPVTPPAAPKQPPVPIVSNMSLDKAKELAKKSGYDVTVSGFKQTENASLHNYVMEQQVSVPAGAKSFSVVVGQYIPPKIAGVGNYVGKHVDALGPAGGLKVVFGTPKTVTDKADDNKVLAQSIAPGTKVKEGTVVTLTLGVWVPPPPEKYVPDVSNLPAAAAAKKMEAAGCTFTTAWKDTAWPEQDGNIIAMDAAPKSVCKKNVPVGLKVGKFTPAALDVRAVPIPDNNNYLLMIKGGTPPYDVRASFDVPKNVYVAGTKYCEIVPLKDNPPGWISYRVSPRADMTARFSITDSKGVKHQYDVTMKKNLK